MKPQWLKQEKKKTKFSLKSFQLHFLSTCGTFRRHWPALFPAALFTVAPMVSVNHFPVLGCLALTLFHCLYPCQAFEILYCFFSTYLAKGIKLPFPDLSRKMRHDSMKAFLTFLTFFLTSHSYHHVHLFLSLLKEWIQQHLKLELKSAHISMHFRLFGGVSLKDFITQIPLLSYIPHSLYMLSITDAQWIKR